MASTRLDVDFAAVFLESLRYLDACFCFPSSPRPLFPLGWHPNEGGVLRPPTATTTAVRRAGPPPFGHRARGARTTTSDYVQKTLLLGARFSSRLSGRTSPLPVASQLCGGPTQAPSTRRFRSALSQHVATCRPRAPQLPAQLREQPGEASGSPADLYVSLRFGSLRHLHAPKTTILESPRRVCSDGDTSC